MAEREYKDSEGNVVTLDKLVRIEPEWAANIIRWYEGKLDEYEHRAKLHMDRCQHEEALRRRVGELESKLDQCLHVVREYVSSELADDPSQDDPSCQLYPLIELVRKRGDEYRWQDMRSEER